MKPASSPVAPQNWDAVRRCYDALQGGFTSDLTSEELRIRMRGYVANRRECRRTVSPATAPSDAALIAQIYREQGVRGLAAIDGGFGAVLLDERTHTVVLVADVNGTFPLYWTATDAGVGFADRLATLIASLGGARLDLRAAADYLHFGFLFGDRTLAQGVTLVPAGSALVHEAVTNRTEIVTYRTPASLFTGSTESNVDDYREGVRSAFNGAVDNACDADGLLGLSLSGGLDSRAILSAIAPERRPLATYTVGARYCADHLIAAKLSRLSRTDHFFLKLGNEYLRDFLPNLERMIALTDGMYLSHGLTEMLALSAVEHSGMDILLRGHCGELAKMRLAWPFHTDDRLHAMRDTHAFGDYFFSRINYVSRGVDVESLFAAQHRDAIQGAARHSFDEVVARVSLSPADLCSYIYLTQHHRRFTIPSLELFRTKVDVRLPFADPGFLRVLLAGPTEWRDSTDLHRHITGRNDLRLLRVRNSNTGVPGSAHPLIERLFDPVNTILKRLNVPGYRHYHQFDIWMRQQLLATVERVLFDDETRARSLYDHERLAQIVAAMMNGSADHAYLLQVLLLLELWQRQSGARVSGGTT